MAPGLILWSVASPISSLLLVGRRERESLAFTVAELLLKVGAVMAGAMLASMTLAVAALSVAAIVINLGALWRILRVASASVADLIRPALRVTVVTLPCVVIVMLARPLPPIGILAVAGAAWAFSVVLAARLSPEVRALLSGSHD
jgi:O-antigen/teichoic acid export membrane protein